MSTMQSVEAALEEVAGWAEEQTRRQQADLVEVEDQIKNLRMEIASLGEKLGSMETLRKQLNDTDPVADKTKKAYSGIFGTMVEQAREFGRRAGLLAAKEKARRDELLTGLPSSAVASKVAEYEQFRNNVEPTLDALPESYRKAMREHHDGVVTEIEKYLAEALAPQLSIDGEEEIHLDLVYGIDAPEGQPELLVCVLPIADVAMTAWSERDEDAMTLIGARVVQAIYEATRTHGPKGAHAVCGGHQGLLAVEVDLLGAGQGIIEALPDTMRAVLANAPELDALNVRIRPVRVDLDFLLPPELPDEEA